MLDSTHFGISINKLPLHNQILVSPILTLFCAARDA